MVDFPAVFGTIAPLLVLLLNWLAYGLLAREWAIRGHIARHPSVYAILASTAWAVQTVALTEVTSYFRHFEAGVITPAICVLTAALLALWWRAASGRGVPGPLADLRSAVSETWKDAYTRHHVFLIAAILLIARLAMAGITTAFTTYDVMIYHMPRVMHWTQNHSVAHYATSQWRELFLPPFNSYAMAMVYMLTGRDNGVSLPQWFAMVNSLIAIVLVVRLIRGESTWRHESLAVAFAISLPIGLIEAMTPQNDYIAAYWLIAFTAMLLLILREPASRTYRITAGFALGIGAITKSTMIMFGIPFAVIFWAMLLWRTRRKLYAWELAAWCLVGVAILNGAFLVRNYTAIANPFGPPEVSAPVFNRSVTPSVIASNLIRNAALYTATGNSVVTQKINDTLLGLHRLTGRDLNDPATTYCGICFSTPRDVVISDAVASLIYPPLLVLVLIGIYVFRRSMHSPVLTGYVVALGLGCVLFCAAMSWQPWHARFHLLWFIAAAPFAGIVLGDLTAGLADWIPRALTVAFGAFAVLVLAINISRPFSNTAWEHQPREQQYFLIFPQLYEPIREQADAVIRSGCQEVGLALRESHWEYPLWVMLRDRGFRGHLQPVNVEGRLMGLEDPGYKPCTVVSLEPSQALNEGVPFLSTSEGLRWDSQVRIPWGIEDHGAVEHGFAWLGWQREEGLHATLIAPSAGNAELALDVSPGPSIAGPNHVINIDAAGVTRSLPISGRSKVTATIPVTAGPNKIVIWSPERPSIFVQPNGDSRHLLIGLHGIEARTAPSP